jgi:exonuclease III
VETWNVLSLYRSGAVRNLTEVTQEYGPDVLAIQEVRCLEKSILEKKSCTVYCSCHDKQHCFGTGFIVSKWLRTQVIDFKSIDMKIYVLRIKGRFQNYSIISMHAPMEEKSEMEKDQFYEQLENIHTMSFV